MPSHLRFWEGLFVISHSSPFHKDVGSFGYFVAFEDHVHLGRPEIHRRDRKHAKVFLLHGLQPMHVFEFVGNDGSFAIREILANFLVQLLLNLRVWGMGETDKGGIHETFIIFQTSLFWAAAPKG